jgi:hypothetical protein
MLEITYYTRLSLHWLPLDSPVQTITRFQCDNDELRGFYLWNRVLICVYIRGDILAEHGGHGQAIGSSRDRPHVMNTLGSGLH